MICDTVTLRHAGNGGAAAAERRSQRAAWGRLLCTLGWIAALALPPSVGAADAADEARTMSPPPVGAAVDGADTIVGKGLPDNHDEVNALPSVEHSEDSITHRMVRLMLQLAVILVAARLGGLMCRQWFRIPEVLGELGAGILIGPFALGPLLGGLFTAGSGNAVPVSPELYGIATLASVLLLYLAGLETDLPMFIRYSLAGSAVGVGGVVFSFVLGDAVAVWGGLADSYLDPAALFLGTISTATSVGITARVLGERQKLDSPEGVTILAGAVIDDVLGIVILAVVIRVAGVLESDTGSMPWGQVGVIAAQALGFWLGCTALGLALSKWIGRGLALFRSPQAMASVSLALALLLAGLAESCGLAMIIGAYIMGMSLSRLDFAEELRERLMPMYHTLVAVFFCVMGMMVNLHAIRGVLGFALVYSLVAVAAKVGGCGIPALFMKFNRLGALRVGIGMLPRGEVALIVAGIGLSQGIVGEEVFGVAILMTLITTVIAPLVMARIFDDRPGTTTEGRDTAATEPIRFELPGEDAASFVLSRIIELFEHEECYVYQPDRRTPLYQVRKDDMTITVRRDGSELSLHGRSDGDREYARLMALEAVAGLIGMLESLRGRRGDRADQLRTAVLG